MDDAVTWEYMVEHYPHMWIAISNPIMDGPNVIRGIIHRVLSDDEVIDYEDEHWDEGLIFRRTGGESNGPIRANFIIETN